MKIPEYFVIRNESNNCPILKEKRIIKWDKDFLIYDNIIDFLNEKSNEVWTLREIAYEIKISNVTIKKYMDYLESIGKVDLEMNFGNVGRPEYKYFVKK